MVLFYSLLIALAEYDDEINAAKFQKYECESKQRKRSLKWK